MPAKLSGSQRTAITPEAKLSQGVSTNTDLCKMGAGLSRGPKGLVASNAPWSNTWPATGDTLDIDFVNDKSFIRGQGQGSAFQNLTYTRASNGTYIGADGLLKGSGSDKGALGLNLAVSPLNFTSGWIGNNYLLASNIALAPDKTQTATKLISTSVNNTHEIHQTLIGVTGTYTMSVYVKASEYNYVLLWESGTTGNKACFNLIAGSIGLTTGTPNANIVDAGDGWWRCSISATVSSANFAGSIVPVSSNSTNVSYTGDGISGVLIWGCQYELGSSATTYFPTNINTPRIDWANTPPNRNLLYYTGDYTNTVWFYVGVTVSGNAMYETATTGNHSISQGFTTGNPFTGIYTISVEVYPNGRDVINLAFNVSTALHSVTYKFSTNTFSGIGTYVASYTSTILSDGYVRLTLTTINNGSGALLRIMTTDLGNLNYTGDITKGVFFRNPQAEIGSSFTSYQYIYAIRPLVNPLTVSSVANGYLCEGPKTNILLWCRDATNAVWTNTNITPLKNQIGIDGVANACSSLTATSANGTCTQTVTATSADRTISIYLKRISGIGDIQVTLDGVNWISVDLSNSIWNRIVMGKSAITNPVIGIKIVTSGDAVAIDYGQIENTVVVSSPILTTSATATRAVDLSSTKNNYFLGQLKGTWYFELYQTTTFAASNPTLLTQSQENGAANLLFTGAPFYCQANDGTQTNSTPSAFRVSQIYAFFKCAFGYNAGTKSCVLNGGSSGEIARSYTTTSAFSPARQTITIGTDGNGNSSINGCIKRVIHIPDYRGDQMLVEMTRP